jgi:hypothetical protein
MGQFALFCGGIVDCEARLVGLTRSYDSETPREAVIGLVRNGFYEDELRGGSELKVDNLNYDNATSIDDILKNDVFLPKTIAPPTGEDNLINDDLVGGSCLIVLDSEPGSSLSDLDRSVKSGSNLKSRRLRKKKTKKKEEEGTKLENKEQKTPQKEEERRKKVGGEKKPEEEKKKTWRNRG